MYYLLWGSCNIDPILGKNTISLPDYTGSPFVIVSFCCLIAPHLIVKFLFTFSNIPPTYEWWWWIIKHAYNSCVVSNKNALTCYQYPQPSIVLCCWLYRESYAIRMLSLVCATANVWEWGPKTRCWDSMCFLLFANTILTPGNENILSSKWGWKIHKKEQLLPEKVNSTAVCPRSV